jgi:hypothetical protein
MKKHSLWKIVGLAGLAGVAATGVAVAPRNGDAGRTHLPTCGPDCTSGSQRSRMAPRW